MTALIFWKMLSKHRHAYENFKLYTLNSNIQFFIATDNAKQVAKNCICQLNSQILSFSHCFNKAFSWFEKLHIREMESRFTRMFFCIRPFHFLMAILSVRWDSNKHNTEPCQSKNPLNNFQGKRKTIVPSTLMCFQTYELYLAIVQQKDRNTKRGAQTKHWFCNGYIKQMQQLVNWELCSSAVKRKNTQVHSMLTSKPVVCCIHFSSLLQAKPVALAIHIKSTGFMWKGKDKTKIIVKHTRIGLSGQRSEEKKDDR